MTENVVELPPPSERIRALEAMLFASPGPVKLVEIAEATGWDRELVSRDLDRLAQTLEGRGIELQRVAGALRLVTVPSMAGYVESLLKIQSKKRLSRAQLETLAIIAYKQPVTRAQMESYRGVNCDRTVAQLVELGLVKEVGRAELPGRPVLFGTADEFLHHFGIDSLGELPSLDWTRPAPEPEIPEVVEQLEETEAEEDHDHLRRTAMDPIKEDLVGQPTTGLKKLLARIRSKGD